MVRIESLGAHVSVRRTGLVSSRNLSTFSSPAFALYFLAGEGFGGEGGECFVNLEVFALKVITAGTTGWVVMVFLVTGQLYAPAADG